MAFVKYRLQVPARLQPMEWSPFLAPFQGVSFVLSGVMSGGPGKTRLGDVVVASKTIDLSGGAENHCKRYYLRMGIKAQVETFEPQLSCSVCSFKLYSFLQSLGVLLSFKSQWIRNLKFLHKKYWRRTKRKTS